MLFLLYLLISWIPPSYGLIGGHSVIADYDEFNYVAQIIVYPPEQEPTVCGGTVLNHNTILTAAHCVSDIKEEPYFGVVIVGCPFGYSDCVTASHVTQWYAPSKIVVYPKYSELTNDIALVFLKNSIQYPGIIPARLPSEEYVEYYTDISILGYGTNKQGILDDSMMKIQTNLISNEECEQFGETIRKTQVCDLSPYRNMSTCAGDSGSPVIYRINDTNYVIAVVSAGAMSCNTLIPNVNTRVSEYVPWIKNTMNQFGVVVNTIAYIDESF